MGCIVLFLTFASVWYIVRKSLTDAFLCVYMASLLLCPGWARWIIPGLPDPTFSEAAVLPIAAVFLLRNASRWKFSFGDILIAFLMITMGVSELINAGYSDAQNLIFDVVASGAFPYLLAKGLINTNTLRVQFARRFVWFLAIVFVTTLYEFKFAVNPFNMAFARFFPGQSEGWVTTFRYGFPRVAGPFAHAIENGVVTLIGFQFAFWLWDSNAWEPHFRYRLGNLKKSSALLWAMVIELIISFVRGPQIGTGIAWCLNWIGRGNQPKRRCVVLLIALVCLGLPAVSWFNSYASVGRGGARTQSQETAAYRKELADKYMNVALQRVWFGWGTSGWPKIPGMPSIDNNYLLLSLRYGFIATAFFVAILLTSMFRLFRNGMKYAPVQLPARSLSFVLLGTYAGITFSLATVYLGVNVFPIFFMITGFTEGYLVAGGDRTWRQASVATAAGQQDAKPDFQFKRIVA